MSDEEGLVSGAGAVSFLTPYLAGSQMMHLHLESIRRFHPEAPVLVSKKGGGEREMEAYRSAFGIRYWMEECSYEAAFRRLLDRCDTEYACFLDHDTILLASIDSLRLGLVQDRYDLVGIEERIRVPDRIWTRSWPDLGGWLRFAPGYLDATFLLFNREKFLRKWGLGGLASPRERIPGWSWELHYGLCEKLSRHHYLMPYHTTKYGLGNLLTDAGKPMLWHAWYGSHDARMIGAAPGDRDGTQPDDSTVRQVIESAERAFLADYPNLDLSDRAPAWWPGCDIEAEQLAVAQRAAASERQSRSVESAFAKLRARMRRAWAHGLQGTLSRIWGRVRQRLHRQ